MGMLQVAWIEMAGLREIYLVLIDHVGLFGLPDQFGPVVRMGDVDQGQGPLAHAYAFQVSNPVFGDDHVLDLADTELIRVFLDGDFYIRLLLQITAGQGTDGPAALGKLNAGREDFGLSQ